MMSLFRAIDDRMPRICHVTSLATRHTRLIYAPGLFLLRNSELFFSEIQNGFSQTREVPNFFAQRNTNLINLV